MLLTTLVPHLHQAFAQPLPGWAAQKNMAPIDRANPDRRRLAQDNHRQGAVLLLLYPDKRQALHFVLIRRPDYDGAHSGQIALPGGKRETDETLEAAACRETEEEIGVPPETYTLLGQLSSLYIPVSNFMVYPFVAYSMAQPYFQADPHEVAEVIETPLERIASSHYRNQYKTNHPRLGWTEIPYYDVFGHRVWGATAMILSEFSRLIWEIYDENIGY